MDQIPNPTAGDYATVTPVSSVDPVTAAPRQRAFPTPHTQVGSFVTRLIEASADRQIRNARIASRLNMETPHDPAELKAAGLDWKSNFTTRPLSTLLSRAHSRFPRAIRDVKYLTSAKLPARFPNASAKTARFREALTEFLRSDPRWDMLVEDLAFENVAFGWTAALWLSEDEWLPVAARQDELYLPPGTRQYVTSASAMVYRQELLLHQALALVEKARAAMPVTMGGAAPVTEGYSAPRFSWDVVAFAAAINAAVPEDVRSSATESHRVLEDLRRQLSAANVFGTGSKVVELRHVFVTEITGKVSHYITDSKGTLLFWWEDRFPNLTQTAAFFALELGDRTMLGSKGVGRLAYTLASVVDRSANDTVDRFALSGKVFVKAPEARHRRFRMSVVGNVVLIDDSYELIPQVSVEASVEPSIALDTFLGRKMDEIAGTVGPIDLKGERVTAAAVNVLTAKEAERQDNPMSRWLKQFGYMVTEIQRRLIESATIKDEAVLRFREELSEFLNEEELAYLARRPAMTSIEGWTMTDRQMVAMLCTEARGNPAYNQRAVEATKIAALHSDAMADAVLLPDEDPTQTAEQTRTQLLENNSLLDGVEIPVSPRDAHVAHLDALVGVLQSALQTAVNDPNALVPAKAMVSHARQHVDYGVSLKLPGIEQYAPLVAQVEAALNQTLEEEAKAAGATVPGIPVPPDDSEPAPPSLGIGLEIQGAPSTPA